MNIYIMITCIIKNDEGVIEKLKYFESKSLINFLIKKQAKTKNENSISKKEFITYVETLKKEGNIVRITNEKNVEIVIVDHKYLRSKGDQNTNNDLIDVKECK